MPTRRCPHCDLYFAGTAVLDLHVRNVHGPEESTMEALPSRGYLGTLAAARRYDDDGDENSEPPPTHDQPSRTIVDPNYWDNTYPRPPLSMESMMGSFAIEPVNGRNIGPSQRVGPGDPTVQPPREYTVVFEARDVNQRMQFASNTPFQAFLQRLEMVSASVASTISGRSTGFTLADGPWWYSLVNRQHVKETVRKPLTSMLFYQAMVSELLRVPTPWILAVVSHVSIITKSCWLFELLMYLSRNSRPAESWRVSQYHSLKHDLLQGFNLIPPHQRRWELRSNNLVNLLIPHQLPSTSAAISPTPTQPHQQVVRFQSPCW